MLEELEALAKVSDIDADALRTEQELVEIPSRISELEADVNKLSELLDVERNQLAEADALLQAQDEEINNQNQALARSKAKGARARNMREADAVERELEVIRRSLKDRETERDTLREAIGKRRASVEKHEKEFGDLEAFAADEKAKSQARISELEAKRDEVLVGRDELATRIPKDVQRRYDRIRKARGGTGVAPLKAGGCSGCFVQLPPQQVIAVQRAETFEQCPRCQRFLVMLSYEKKD